MKGSLKNILITGGAGFIGSNFLKIVTEKYPNVNFINLDLLTYAGKLENLKSIEKNKNYHFVRGDICDFDLVTSIFNKFNIDGVINFAAESHVDNSIKDPSNFIRTNINGVYNLLIIAYNFWMISPFKSKASFENSRFLQISTDEVYGSAKNISFDEKSRYNPSSPYSSSKASADLIVKSFHKTFGLNTLITLSSNNFGMNQHEEKFMPVVINCIIEGRPIPVYGDGSNIRDWIYVDDNCDAIDLVFNFGSFGDSYNIGGGNEYTNLEIIHKIYNSLSKYYNSKINELMINHVIDRHGHDKRYSISTDKIKSDLGWNSNKLDFDGKIDKFCRNFLKNL